MTPSPETPQAPSALLGKAPSGRQLWMLLFKGAFSIALLAVIVSTVLGRGGEGFDDALGRLRWEWVGVALLVHVIQTSSNVARWRALLVGQGIHPPVSFLAGSLLIGRFFGAVTPGFGGHLGYSGWRIYDIAKRTGKVARASATIAIDLLLGQLAFGVVVMTGAVLFGHRFIGASGVLAITVLYCSLIVAGVTFLVRPSLVTLAAARLPTRARVRIQVLIDALSAYRGKGSIVVSALLLAILNNTCHMLVYVCVAQALDARQLGVGEVFFGTSLQILATMLPASINGIGLREAAAIALYTSPHIGVPMAVAVLIPTIGFAVEMTVSALGAPVFFARRASYAPSIRVEDAERENARMREIDFVHESAWPRIERGLAIGFGSGLLAGAIVGIAEGAVVVASGNTGPWVIGYGAMAYALFCAAAGGALAGVLAWSGRVLRREAVPEPRAYARMSAFLVAACAFGLGAFRIRRDVFEEQLRWASLPGVGVLLCCLLASVILYLSIAASLRLLLERRPFEVMLRSWGSPAIVGGLVALVCATTVLAGEAAEASSRPRDRGQPPAGAGNVLVIVVDTLRADHLPSYGYSRGSTPNLDAFAQDAIRFDQAFANASWTRPSFASILTGRYPSSHGVMAKSDALPAELVTMSEAFAASGWHTAGFVTNYNVGPYYNFDQGFDEYHYLEPDFVLGADDSAAKLLLVQALRQQIERVRDRFLGVQPGTAYQDAETVNQELVRWLDRAPSRPWMLFVGYMDPHDPYFEHPYSGTGYARAAHQSPEVSERDRLVELYDGEITYWDEHFGRLIATLRERGLYDDLTIVITSDHGEEFAEHGGFWHGTTLYDEQIRVPLLVKLPRGRRAGTTVRHWVQSIDLMPTLLREAEVPVPPGVQGGDLFEGTDRVYAEESHENNVLEAVRERRGTDELKLITANSGNPRGLPDRELFRVDLDPGETQDLSGSDAEGLARAEQAMSAARERAGEDAVEAIQVQQSCAETCRLCRLGYSSGSACDRCSCQ